jgi:hypothetical protein
MSTVREMLLPPIGHAEPAHQDRLKPPSCTDRTVVKDMRRIFATSLTASMF